LPQFRSAYYLPRPRDHGRRSPDLMAATTTQSISVRAASDVSFVFDCEFLQYDYQPQSLCRVQVAGSSSEQPGLVKIR
jgi:hypothetical protein